jgi:hypothetical protein
MRKPASGRMPSVRKTVATPNMNLNGLQRKAIKAPSQVGIGFKFQACG